MVPFSFAGEALVPLPEAALWWPRRGALLVADLHLEKASHWAARGMLLPPYDSAETIARLTRLVRRLQPRELWCLGDSFHDAGGPARLSADSRRALAALAAALDLIWITGNHDPLARAPCGALRAEARVDGLMLRHDARADERGPEISGHFHPRLTVRARGRRIARRCFVLGASRLILPAFGALAGGLDAADPAILAAAGRPSCALLPVPGALLRFPLTPGASGASGASSD